MNLKNQCNNYTLIRSSLCTFDPYVKELSWGCFYQKHPIGGQFIQMYCIISDLEFYRTMDTIKTFYQGNLHYADVF